jgi:hypothetical protein
MDGVGQSLAALFGSDEDEWGGSGGAGGGAGLGAGLPAGNAAKDKVRGGPPPLSRASVATPWPRLGAPVRSRRS